MSEWYLHQQNPDFLTDHEYSIFKDGTPIILMNPMPGQDRTLHQIVELIQVANDYADHKVDITILRETVERLFSHD